MLADCGYDTNALIGRLHAAGIEPVIPCYVHRSLQRAYDRVRYRERNRIERLFCRLKQFRRVATRYDKLAARFASFVALTAAVLWLR